MPRTATGTAAKRSGMSLNTRNTLVGMTFILPNFIGFFCFVLSPVAFSFVLSFMEWDGFTEMKFVGIENFLDIFDDRVFRAAIFFPYVASIVAVAAVFKAMFMKDGGPINEFLGLFLPDSMLPGWLASTDWALAACIIVQVWKNMGYFMIIYLAALQDIPYSLYEAASIDGATKWQQFKSITLPMLTPSHFYVLMMLVINSFKTFDLIFTLTEGGPGTSTTMLSQYIYNESFISWNYGGASAAAMVLFLIVAAVTLLQFRVERKFNDFM